MGLYSAFAQVAVSVCRLQGPNGGGAGVRLAKWLAKPGIPFGCGKTDVFKFEYEDCGGFGIAQAWPCPNH